MGLFCFTSQSDPVQVCKGVRRSPCEGDQRAAMGLPCLSITVGFFFRSFFFSFLFFFPSFLQQSILNFSYSLSQHPESNIQPREAAGEHV